MHSLEDIEKSRRQYDEAKAYFMSLSLPDCVIEILNEPITEWPIHFTPTAREMRRKIRESSSRMKAYISIYIDTDGAYFFYMDYISKVEVQMPAGILISSEIVDLEDYKPIDINDVFKQFGELIKSIQNR